MKFRQRSKPNCSGYSRKANWSGSAEAVHIKVDVRVIAATHRDLEAAVDSADFREELYYRLNVMPIILPALRDRPEDVPDLASFLVGRVSEMQGRKLSITDAAIRRLTQ